MAEIRRKIMFDEYKTIKDEIIAVSEQKFENMLTKQFKEFKIEIINEMDRRFNENDRQFTDVDKRLNVIYWLFGITISIIIALKFIK